MSVPFRVGQGIDFHVLIEDPTRPLLIGGVEIPGDLALKGHSDADVLLHALSDAILGAVGKEDIGSHFSDKDPANKNLDSSVILKHCLQLAAESGWKTGNCDITLIGEKPRISSYRSKIEENLSKLTGIPVDCITVKATTTEKMGALGRSEGLGCTAVILMYRESTV